jgi:hypothetical protein
MNNKLTMLILLSVLTLSCASNNAPIVPTEASISEQEALLKQIYIGQDEQDVVSILSLSASNYFEVLEDNIEYRYLNYWNTDTNVALGVFFIGGKLASVISETDAGTLYSCRTPFKTAGKHWLEYGVKAYSDWIIEKNALDGSFDYRIHNSRAYSSKSTTARSIENATTLIAYSPFIVIGSPFILHAWASGKFEEDEKKRLEVLEKIALAKAMPLNTHLDELTTTFGFPIKTGTINSHLALAYEDIYHTFGTSNSKVIWKESPSMLEMMGSAALKYGNSHANSVHCESLEPLWQ